MTIQSNTAPHDKDCWRTPPEIYAALNAEFSFVGDVAASDKNHLHENYLTENEDALSDEKPWGVVFPNGYVFCNPPYSDPMPWVKKAQQEDCYFTGVVMLVPADTSVGWFKQAMKDVSEVRFITGGGLSFINQSTGKPVSGNNKGSMLLIWNRHRPAARQFGTVDRDVLMRCGRQFIEWGKDNEQAA